MYVCICNAVTDKQIRRAINDGCGSMRELRMELGVAGCCGKCAPDARALLLDSKREQMTAGQGATITLVPA
ncbi:bacterioferritin-associated ferredoxin [Chitinimonas viridis]|uniref:Bacterioferritin-associated ferredoxin n=2 Tax=Chitinimonas TaxID=240411 RepID=A0ABT8B354_9NEIS|nr:MULTISPECIES: bacterioferritin-associated ferredoxin [Chitinimonas]MDN3576439.1 bacterioferritin-associated ferredoxin [Chitinimonas viridis]GLR14902.1 (2Fe-2S)-binding protein [Chitinimonas prasina]